MSLNTQPAALRFTLGRSPFSFAALALAFTFLSTAGIAQPPARVFRVEAGEVKRIEIAETLEVTGSLESLNEMELSALGRGRITLAKAYEGMRVNKGDVIYQLDDRELTIALSRAKAELEKAQAQEKKMRSGSLPQEIVQARKAVAAAQARADAAKDDWERVKPLVEQKIISEGEATRTKSAFEVAASELAQAQAKLQLVEDGFRTEEVMVAEAEVKVWRASVADIERQLADLKVTAPDNAVVVAKLKEAGEWVNQGEPLARLITLDPLKLRVEAPQSRVSRIQAGQIATMKVDGLDDVFQAEVRAVVPQAKPETRNFPVLLRVANPDGKLAAGMFTRVSLKVGEGRPALTIPRHAMQHRGTKLVVYAIEPLPPGFKPPDPPKADPKGPKKPGKGGPPPGPMAKPDSLAREVEIRVISEMEKDLIIEPVQPGALQDKTPIVLYGASQLQDGSLLSHLDVPGAGLPGAG